MALSPAVPAHGSDQVCSRRARQAGRGCMVGRCMQSHHPVSVQLQLLGLWTCRLLLAHTS